METTGSQVIADYAVEIAKVISSAIVEADSDDANRAVQFAIAGAGAPDDLPSADGAVGVTDEDGARTEDADVFGALGISGRPLPPTVSGEVSEHAEVVCIRYADGLLPIAARDVRLRMGGNAPNEGTIAFVGYGGGYHSISPVDNDDLTKGAIQVIYCGFDFNASGVAQKAHTIIIDPSSGNESISIIHANGQAVFLQDDEIQLQTDGIPQGTGSTIQQSWARLKPGEIRLQSDAIVLNGTVYIGDNIGAVPLLPGPSSPACPRLMLNPSP